MRCFLAFNIDCKEREKLKKIQDVCKLQYRDKIKWVEIENLHITYLFIGELKKEFHTDIINLLEEFKTRLKPFTLSKSDSIIEWNSIKNPRVLWVKYNTDIRNPEIKNFIESRKLFIERAKFLTNNQNLSENLDFKFHITLGRVKNNTEINVKNFDKNTIECYNNESFDLQINSLSLFQSTLTDKGPIYKKNYTLNYER